MKNGQRNLSAWTEIALGELLERLPNTVALTGNLGRWESRMRPSLPAVWEQKRASTLYVTAPSSPKNGV